MVNWNLISGNMEIFKNLKRTEENSNSSHLVYQASDQTQPINKIALFKSRPSFGSLFPNEAFETELLIASDDYETLEKLRGYLRQKLPMINYDIHINCNSSDQSIVTLNQEQQINCSVDPRWHVSLGFNHCLAIFLSYYLPDIQQKIFQLLTDFSNTDINAQQDFFTQLINVTGTRKLTPSEIKFYNLIKEAEIYLDTKQLIDLEKIIEPLKQSCQLVQQDYCTEHPYNSYCTDIPLQLGRFLARANYPKDALDILSFIDMDNPLSDLAQKEISFIYLNQIDHYLHIKTNDAKQQRRQLRRLAIKHYIMGLAIDNNENGNLSILIKLLLKHCGFKDPENFPLWLNQETDDPVDMLLNMSDSLYSLNKENAQLKSLLLDKDIDMPNSNSQILDHDTVKPARLL